MLKMKLNDIKEKDHVSREVGSHSGFKNRWTIKFNLFCVLDGQVLQNLTVWFIPEETPSSLRDSGSGTGRRPDH